MVADAGSQQATSAASPAPQRRRRWTGRRRRPALIAAGLAVVTIAAVTVRGSWPFDSSAVSIPGISQGSAGQWPPVPEPTPGRPSSLPPVAAFTGTLRTAEEWASMFAEQWRGERPVAEALSTSADSWDHYNLSYDVDALTAAYLATGRTEYIDEGLRLLDNVMSTARRSADLPTSDHRDDYLGWVSAEEGGREVPLYESYLWRYATGLLRVIEQDPLLRQDPTRQARYGAALAFAERNIFEKWQLRGADDNIFRSRTHMAAHWALIALELSQITTDADRRRTYLDTMHAIDTDMPNEPSSLREQVRLNPRYPTAYVWSDEWGKTGGRAQDVSHGNAVIAYVVAANAARSDWTDVDMHRFLQTFTLAVWPATPRKGQPEGADSVDGKGVGNGWFSDGFVKLGRFDPELQRRLETHDVGRSVQFLANNALNVSILACRGIAPSAAPRTTPVCRLG
jgi:hypothetical protein